MSVLWGLSAVAIRSVMALILADGIGQDNIYIVGIILIGK
jgi:hypothetical protein